MTERKNIYTPFVKQCLVTAAVAINMAGFGCSFGFPGIMLPQLQSLESSISVTKTQVSWLASVGSIPMIVGNFLVPAVTSRAGRKAAIFTVTLIVILGWFTITLATSYEMLLIGRMLQGLSFGMFVPIRSIYIGECTSPRYRGSFLTTTALAQTFGLCFVHLTGSLLSYQQTALCCISFPFTCTLLMIYSPESPSWLATRGKYDKCRNNFIWLRGDDEIQELDKLIQSAKHFEAHATKQNKIRQIILVAKKKEFFKPVILMSALFVMLTHAGGTMMGAYSVTVLELLMSPQVNAHFWMVALDFQRLFFSVAAVYFIHKVKRRTMLFTTGILCAGSQLCMGVYIFAKTNRYLPFPLDSLWIPGILINVQMMTVSMGMQPLPAVIAGEVFPLQHRSLAGSIGLLAQCGSVFLVLKSFPSLITSLGLEGTFALYSGVITTCLVIAWVLLPETSGRTLQQIEEHFRGGPLPDPAADVTEKEPLKESDGKLSKVVQ